ncbi:MAG: oligopeptide transporter, OPT family [Candidatus Marinimicrobia bacterium]|nr:oligopeptide transporter, OPT family [Candidatus Neomarinimicrobiota bacterium]
MTIRTFILGIILSIILGSANAYLGLFAGMTISASIPAAVLSMGILSLFKNSSIKENNLVQTSASAGESLAAGIIFTIPALILIGREDGYIGWDNFNYSKILLFSMIGGIMGIFFTIPLRNALIRNAKLSFPEGQATAKVLQVGEDLRQEYSKASFSNFKSMIYSSVIGALFKLFQSGFHILPEVFSKASHFFNSTLAFGLSLSPALVSVGFIVGKRISLMIFSGGALAWFLILPILSILSEKRIDDPMNFSYTIWNSQIRYIGVGAMLVGGIWSLISVASYLLKELSNRNSKSNFDSKDDLSYRFVIVTMSIIYILLVYLFYQEVGSLLFSTGISTIIIIMAFLFCSVAAYMAGIVGSSNNPISGVTIATIMFASSIILLLKGSIDSGPIISILIGSVICCAAAIGGDNMQDLKTGEIINASPWKQQIMQLVGAISAAVVMGFVIIILHDAYGIGTGLKAPQANLMKMVSVGIFSKNLPWNMVLTGSFIAILIIIYNLIFKSQIQVLAVAVGIYLPLELSTPILIGGLIASSIKDTDKGILISSGIITGEALMGIFIALPIFLSGNKNWWPQYMPLEIGGIIIFILFLFWFWNRSR